MQTSTCHDLDESAAIILSVVKSSIWSHNLRVPSGPITIHKWTEITHSLLTAMLWGISKLSNLFTCISACLCSTHRLVIGLCDNVVWNGYVGWGSVALLMADKLKEIAVRDDHFLNHSIHSGGTTDKKSREGLAGESWTTVMTSDEEEWLLCNPYRHRSTLAAGTCWATVTAWICLLEWRMRGSNQGCNALRTWMGDPLWWQAYGDGIITMFSLLTSPMAKRLW